eukprot:scaffold871_cov130-Cylindrotheca_fusiformis.AAC.10
MESSWMFRLRSSVLPEILREKPLSPEIILKTHELPVEESVDDLLKRLFRGGILTVPAVATEGEDVHAAPDSDEGGSR